MNDSSSQARLLTLDELAALIKAWREIRQWSQETLAELSGLSVRTIQRTERGKPSSLDTRRALAGAFEFEDIDLLNKPLLIPTDEQLAEAKVKFDEAHVTLQANPIGSGRIFAKLVQDCHMDLTEPAFELDSEASEVFAAMVDYLREYRDCAEHYSEVEKLMVHREFEDYLSQLHVLGVSMRYATRNVKMRFGGPTGDPLAVQILYLVGFAVGQEPESFATPKTGSIGL
ncbi:helix-turn-helix domain-containing protein [Pseudomonas hormoni]|uniref:Helix-turn-helix domain-containing protein n=1 Tax=Pseudomonas hormoni TaxID=3093767 RepID=A0ABX8EXB7_9PSED|nr:helix-turn-helix domain-containing protein [Pseudomonas hormoni]QVW24130.1 helix-turn-helix domain-containing protein [Pseudomonas hormoni]